MENPNKPVVEVEDKNLALRASEAERLVRSLPTEELLDRLENFYKFECGGGTLANGVDWDELKRRFTEAQPPFDGNPCPACPVEVRMMYAAAVGLLDLAPLTPRYVVNSHVQALGLATVRLAPIVEKHFKNQFHATGKRTVNPFGPLTKLGS